MRHVTPEIAGIMSTALATGDIERIKEYCAEDMRWLVPGHNQLSGWYYGRDAFLAFLGNAAQLTANTFLMQTIDTLTSDEYSTSLMHTKGSRTSDSRPGEPPYLQLSIDVALVLRWQEGKVIEGKVAIFGDGTTQFDQFWFPLHEHITENKIKETVWQTSRQS